MKKVRKMNKDIEVVFAPGCFDQFEGTQEELDAFIAEITQMVNSGELFEISDPVDLDNIPEEDLEVIQRLISEDGSLNRVLQ
jgi:uncharacterized protein YfkK (UPF0435 family)